MRPNRTAPILGALALSIALAACGQAVANPNPTGTPVATPKPTVSPTAKPSATPVAKPKPSSTPVATPKPTVAPAPSKEPEKPTAPAPAPIQVVEHPVPMLGRSLANGVNVRERPDLQAAVLRWDNGDEVYEVRLAKDQVVGVIYGPLLADGESWYQVTSYSSGHNHFGYGWVAGRFLAREANLDDPMLKASIRGVRTGLGHGGSFSADVVQGEALGIEFAAAPMPGSTSCEIDVDFVGTDGVRVDAASFTAHDSIVGAVQTPELDGLLVAAAGTVAVDVVTDCSFLVALRSYQG